MKINASSLQRHAAKILFTLLFIIFTQVCTGAEDEGVTLLKAPIDPHSLPSLQRGAKMFINYCSGCHSLNFMRYNRMAKDIGIVDSNGRVDQQIVKDNLIFTDAKISDTIAVAMQSSEAKNWFGIAPPDLSVIVRARSVDWLYTYLLSFYQDKNRPFGVNNLLFNETAMPDVLVNLRGVQVPIYHTETVNLGNGISSLTNRAIDHLIVTEPGSMSPHQFEGAVADLVNFLNYVAEPTKKQRIQLGVWVVIYLLFFAVLAFLLKKEYWKNISGSR